MHDRMHDHAERSQSVIEDATVVCVIPQEAPQGQDGGGVKAKDNMSPIECVMGAPTQGLIGGIVSRCSCCLFSASFGKYSNILSSLKKSCIIILELSSKRISGSEI